MENRERIRRQAYAKGRWANITPAQRLNEKNRHKLRRLSVTQSQRAIRNQAERQNRLRRISLSGGIETRRRRIPVPSKHSARNEAIRPQIHDIGSRNVSCKHCQALHFEAERTCRGKFSTCCGSEKISLPALHPYPSIFKMWLTENTSDGRNFKTNIRKYNAAFAFASFGHQSINFTSGPQAFVIHGQVYHQTMRSVQNQESSSYAKLYFLDPEYANQERATNEYNSDCKLDMFNSIEYILRHINPFAAAYSMMNDVMKNLGDESHSVTMWITKDRRTDQRRYNLPVANEVAVVFVSENGEPPHHRDIAVYPTGEERLQRLNADSPNCDPMTYPLLFPYGEPGWRRGIPKVVIQNLHESDDADEENSRNVSMLEFYSYYLQDRGPFNPLLHSGKLTQQFIVDAFLKVEGQRLNWNRMNQKKLRVDLYLGLMDYVHNRADKQDLKAGRVIILPSSFTGGKRYMQQNYQDAMILVAKFGKPDLFITFTCNPKWNEITNELQVGETALDRPDLVATVFNLKLKEFLNDMTCAKGGVLGNVVAYMSVIEFQKRGLPHCHMLFILEDNDKLKTPEAVDSAVCAEIPSEDDDVLREIVTACMLHGPCGEFNKKAPCMEEEKGVVKCTKNFPKEFADETNVNVNGYPMYRRRNDGKKVFVRNAELDNRWVVPYNPYLSRKYRAHINVEVCSSIQSVKYIFKYIYKGYDAALVQVNEASKTGTLDWDEIRTFLDTRYISAPESIWRLRKYDMSTRSHSVERLPVHLPSQQTVVFEEGSEENELRAAEMRGTKLTKWFKLNQEDPEANQYLYSEIPYHYVWNKNSWKTRKRGANKILPRMYSVSPRDMERFCLRLLLMHVRGAKSFDDLKNINGITHETFFEAAKALQLLEDDSELDKALDEAAGFRMPSELRELFSVILVHVRPSECMTLYNKHLHYMAEDYLLNHSEYMAEQLVLRDIKGHLEQFGYSLPEFGLPNPTDAYDPPDEIDTEREREEAEKLVSMMNSDQLSAFNTIMDAVNGHGNNKCFFLSGAGGCGKTFVYKALTAAVVSQGGIVKSVAPTGLAATLLKYGKTVHSGFGISINLDQNTISRFKQGSLEWKELLQTKLIIWDEISMCHVHLLLAVDRSLRDLLNCDEPFGGIPIVVGGDFQQQAPVVVHGSRFQVVESCVKSTYLWKKFKKLDLLQNMRVISTELKFAKWLLDIGAGTEDGKQSDYVKIPPVHLTTDIVKSVFGENINDLRPDELALRAILCPKNDDTMKINDSILTQIDGDLRSYLSIDSVSDCESEEERNQYPIEFLHSLTPMGMPPHVLRLKKGCCIMLLRNLNPKRGMCNGTRLIVESLGANLLECSIFSGDRKGEKVFIPRIALDAKNSDLPFQLRRKQFPIRVAYSMTITKSQGQTFDRIGVYLPDPVFTHGQLYTAFSRVRSEAGLFVEIKENSQQGQIYDNDSNTYAYNCVYRELLQ